MSHKVSLVSVVHIHWFAFGLCFLFLALSRADEPEVVLSTGRVRGQKLVSAANRLYYSFRGIPYAKPPLGFLRFKAPQPPESWNGTLEAFEIPPACSQPWRKLTFPETYSEDCLYINVFTPYLKPPGETPMAVMVWIHGGKHFQGSSTNYKYGADFLMTDDVVVVTFNYRLGVFGFLNSNSKSAQGNAAHKDKVSALRWVQKEISQFGGDPNSVTIFGGSSGGTDVNCLYISPMAQGLFHGAITESGPGCGDLHDPPIKEPGKKLAKSLGCPSSDAEEAVACLRGISAEVLAERQMDVATQSPGITYTPFLLTVEEDYGEEVFMDVPANELLKRSQSEIPYLMGLNSAEGLMFLQDPIENPTQFTDFERDFVSYLPAYIRQYNSRETINDIARKMKGFYFNNKPITAESVTGFINFTMDSYFTNYLIRTAKIVSTHAPVYLYYFTFIGNFEMGFGLDYGFNVTGVGHGEELGYLFYRNSVVPAQNHLSDYPRECTMITQMVRLWTNFAKYGNPTPNETDVLLGTTWFPMNSSLTQHLVINDSLFMNTQNLLPKRVALWETIFQDNKWEAQISMQILAFILILAIISLLYLIYDSSCRKGTDGYCRF